jgi:hypothetical protein
MIVLVFVFGLFKLDSTQLGERDVNPAPWIRIDWSTFAPVL